MFNDKHLSWNWDWAKQMVDTSREMGFAYMAGSSLPVTWRIPSVEMPLGSRIREALCVGYGGVDSYDFHGLETIQCMVERRRGGETGVKWLQAYRGEKFWDALREGRWSRRLMEAALCRSHTLTPARAGFNDILPTDDDMRRLVKDPVAYHYEHNDGLLCTMILHERDGQGLQFCRRRGASSLEFGGLRAVSERLQLRRRHRGPRRALLDANVLAHARRPHHAGQLL